LHTYGSWDFFLCISDCPKQFRTSFPFYKFFYPIISARISGGPCKNREQHEKARHILDTHSTDKSPLSEYWAKELVKILTNAPSNLRYGHTDTNSVVGCMIDPIGDINGHPTTKECEMIRLNKDGYPNVRTRHENPDDGTYYGGQLPVELTQKGGQFYSSTGLHDWPAKDVKKNKLSDGGKGKRVFENLRYSTRMNNWAACTSQKPKPDWNINTDVDFKAYKDQAP